MCDRGSLCNGWGDVNLKDLLLIQVGLEDYSSSNVGKENLFRVHKMKQVIMSVL